MQLAAAAIAAASANAAAIPPGNYVLTHIGTTSSRGLNSFGQVTVAANLSGLYAYTADSFAFLWTPVAPNSSVGSLTPVIGIGLGTDATSINSRGQIGGLYETPSGTYQAFLWTPFVANGTAGNFTNLLVPDFPLAINAYGQAIGTNYLWTPSSPNGTTGSIFSDSRFSSPMSINDIGQVVMSPASGPLLFTPSTPNGSIGTFTPIPGLTATDGAQHVLDQLIGINNYGMILGQSLFDNSGLYQSRTFLWTPVSPNATTGTLSEIPVPAGFTGIDVGGLNNSGQLVGNLYNCPASQPSCPGTPFLYTGGKFYDLTAVDSTLAGAYADGINDAGQILLDGQDVYLLSPAPVPAPAGPTTVAVTIASSPPSRGFTVTGTGCSPGIYSTPQTLNWVPQSNCTITLISPQSDTPGTQYVFTGWQDGTAANPRSIVAPSQPATYTTTYKTQYLVITQSNPPEGGTVSGGGWYDTNSTAILTATAASGFRVAEWVPAVQLTVVGPVSVSLTVSSALAVIADFAPVISPPLTGYAVSLLGTGVTAASPRPLNNLGQVVYGPWGYTVGSNPIPPYPTYPGDLWTPFTANGAYGSVAALPFVPSAINNRGQIAGTGGIPQAVLWSPDVPNGSSGSTSLVSDEISDSAGINNFGQVVGQSGGIHLCPSDAKAPASSGLRPRQDDCPILYASCFLWTPSSPNGATGSNITNPAEPNMIAINDFGQAISLTQLFTPSSPSGLSGMVTTIAGIPNSIANLIDINAAGVIAGLGAFCDANGADCRLHGFLWTPTSPNATSGTPAEIPIPAGYIELRPTSMNNNGQVVGTIRQANGVIRPFLYKNGTVYDLGTTSSQISTATPAGINDAGQIVLNGYPSYPNEVYLLSPGALQLPTADSVSPGSGSAANQTMVFTFSDPRGWQDLDVVNVLINNFLDGRQACYMAYSRPLNVLYLVNDSGTALSQALPLNGSGSIANSQCTVYSGGSTDAGNSNSLILTLNLSFSGSFTGNKVVYLASRDLAANNSGWQALGTWNVPGTAITPTTAGSTSPNTGTGPTQTFTFTFTDTRDWQDLGVVDILINNFLDGSRACYFAYSRPLNQLFLVNDSGTGMLQGLLLPSTNGSSNGQCIIEAGASPISVSGNGNTLTLTVTILFSPSFVGNRVIYMAARDVTDTVNSGWQAMGTWSVQ